MAKWMPNIFLVSLLTVSGARVRYQPAIESMPEQSGPELAKFAKDLAPGSSVLVSSYLTAMYGWMTSDQKLLFKLADKGLKGAWNGVKVGLQSGVLGKVGREVGKKMKAFSLSELQEVSILRVKNIIGATNVIGALSTAHYMYEGGKFVYDKNKAQKELMVSDLTYEVPSDSNDADALVVALDFGVSKTAFTRHEQEVWDLFKKELNEAPASPEACQALFDAALVPLRQALCQVLCKEQDCGCDANDFESPLDEPMKTVPTRVCEGYFSWNSTTATEQELKRNWARYLDLARSAVRQVLADNFHSPALRATSTEALLIDFAHKISEGCALNSSWWNPLGKAAHAARKVANPTPREKRVKQATPRDVIAEKVAQIHKSIHDVTCPELGLAMCRAGCQGYEKLCEDSSKHDEDYVAVVSYKPTYCKQMQDFASRIEPLCKPGWSTFKALAKSFVSISSWLATGALVYYASGEALDLAPHGVEINAFAPAVLFALQSTTRLATDLASGWQDGSKACAEIAKKLIEGN